MTQPTIKEIREAFAEYRATEGCSCCQDVEGHKIASDRLGKLLKVKKYSDGSGYDFYAYQRKEKKSNV